MVHLLIIGIAVLIAGGCALVSKDPDPYEMSMPDSKNEYISKNMPYWKDLANQPVSDMHILAYTSEVKKVLSSEAKDLRYIRKILSTIGVLSGIIATSIHGAIGADADTDTVTMFAAGEALYTSATEHMGSR